MNKIINWTCGGIFRTLGRLLAYVLVGALIGFIIQKSDLKITDLLGIEKVNASTITPSDIKYMSLWCEDDTCDYTEAGATDHSQWLSLNTAYSNPAGHIPGYYLEQLKFRFTLNSSNYLQIGNAYIVGIKFNLNPRIDYGLGIQHWGYILDLTYSDNTTTQITQYSATCAPVTNDNYGVSCVFSINDIAKQIKSFTFRINLPFEVGSIWDGIEAVNFKTYSINTASDTTEAIQQQTDILIQNNNMNTQIITDALEAQQQAIIDSNKVCDVYDKTSILSNHYILSYDTGSPVSNNNFGVTDFIKISSSSEVYPISLLDPSNWASTCIYNVNKVKIICYKQENLTLNSNLILPNDSYYIRFSINDVINKPQYKICKNGSNAIQDTLTDDNTSDAESEATSFFDNFTTNTHGLTGIITAPLNAINSLTNATCTPLHIPIPFLTNKYLDLPCMRSIYESFFGDFMTLFDVITLGIVSYWIMVRIFALVKDFKNPDHDEIEVVDL